MVLMFVLCAVTYMVACEGVVLSYTVSQRSISINDPDLRGSDERGKDRCERESETERERETETETETERLRETERDRERQRETERDRERQREREM